MKRWLPLFVVIVCVLTVLVWQTPAILKAMPSRYVARLPAPVQALGEREHVEMLPTAAAAVDSAQLLPTATLRSPLVASSDTPAVDPVSTTVATPETADSTGPTVTPSPTAPPPTPTPLPLPPTARLAGIQHYFQDWNNCGPATLAMTLSYFGRTDKQSDTARVLKPNPEDRNVTPAEMAAYVQEQTELEALSRINGSLDVLRGLLAAGVPVIVEVGLDPPGEFAWMGWYGHYLLVVAYDDDAQAFWVYDSWFGTSEVPGENATSEGRVLSYEELDRMWRQFNRSYIAVYEAAQAPAVEAVIGENLDDAVMWAAALARVEGELRQEASDPFLWFNLGSVYNGLGDYERAATAFDQARAIDLPWRMLWYQFGPYEAYYEVGRYEDVIVLADVTLQDRPYFEEAFYYKGLALAAQGEPAAARDNLQKAVDFNPNFAPAAAVLAELEQ